MTTSKTIRNELLKKMTSSAIYTKMNRVKKIAGNSISNEVALDIVASQKGIDVYSILKKEGRIDEFNEFKEALPKFDFGDNQVKRIPKPEIPAQGNNNDQNNRQSKIIEKILTTGQKYGINNINQNWIDTISILNFIETASTKFLMDHDCTEDKVKLMKWDVKLAKLEHKMSEEALSKGIKIRTSIGTFFKNYRQVRNDQVHNAHLHTSHITKDELNLLAKNLDIFIKTVFVEHEKYCLKQN